MYVDVCSTFILQPQNNNNHTLKQSKSHETIQLHPLPNKFAINIPTLKQFKDHENFQSDPLPNN